MALPSLLGLHECQLCRQTGHCEKSMVVWKLGAPLAESVLERTWTSGSTRPQSKCKLDHMPARGPWANQLNPLSLSHLITKMGT